MDSYDTIKKFDNIIRLRRCVIYHPVMNVKDYACMKYLDGKVVKTSKPILPVYLYLRVCPN